MLKYAIIALIGCCCVFARSQSSIVFSKTFQTKKRNVPIAILNNHPGYFHVLRYNKIVHDFVIERRGKPNAEILAFTALKLDSINTAAFNYEKLDYQLFEVDYKLYFIFEKVLNHKHTIYLKIIDTTGRTSGFTELGNLEKEAAAIDLRFKFERVANNNLLIVGEVDYSNGVTKKAVTLLDLKTLKPIWIKKIPHHNSVTEITNGFTTNANNDLFYVHYLIKSLFMVKRGVTEQRIIQEFGPVSVVRSNSESKEIEKHVLSLQKVEAIYNATLVPYNNDVVYTGHVVSEDIGKHVYLHTERVDHNNQKVYAINNDLSSEVNDQLTFYDGTDYKDAGYKNYTLKKSFLNGGRLFYITERKQENSYKELLVWNIDLESGKAIPRVVPRKIFYFDDRTRFRKLGECMPVFKNNLLNIYILEEPSNFKTPPEGFKYHDYRKQTSVWGGNVVNFTTGDNAAFTKKLIYANRNFDLIPLDYTSECKTDEAFYFNEGKLEKFGFISLTSP